MKWLQTYRLSVLSSVSVFSVIVLGVSAQYASTTLNGSLLIDGFRAWPQSSLDSFNALNIAVAVLTLFTVPVMLVVDLLRRGAFTSMIVVELAWLGLLWILWLATAGFTADSIRVLLQLCSINFGVPTLQSACKNSQAAEAFGFLIWLALLGYTATLLVMSITSQTRGQRVWTSSVSTATFSAPTVLTNAMSEFAKDNQKDARKDAKEDLKDTYAGDSQESTQQQPLQYSAGNQTYPPQPPVGLNGYDPSNGGYNAPPAVNTTLNTTVNDVRGAFGKMQGFIQSPAFAQV